jgi:hypothetical protein
MRTPDEQKWIKGMERAPKDIQDYVQKLHLELSQCYEYMADKEVLFIIKNEWKSKEELNNKFFHLLSDRPLILNIKR